MVETPATAFEHRARAGEHGARAGHAASSTLPSTRKRYFILKLRHRSSTARGRSTVPPLLGFEHRLAVAGTLGQRRMTTSQPTENNWENDLACGILSARVRLQKLGFVRRFEPERWVRSSILGFNLGSFAGSFVGKSAKSVDSCAISNANGAYSGTVL
jgi:hypothetical protein